MKHLRTILFSLTLWLLPSITQAADIIPPISDPSSHVKQVGFSNGRPETLGLILNSLWDRILNITFAILGSLAVLMLIYSGIQYITSGGNFEKTKRARANIQNVIYGILLLVASYALIDFVVSLAQYIAQHNG